MKNFIHISDLLGDIVGKYSAACDSHLSAIWDAWESAVGKLIAENAKPAAFKGNILTVHTDSSAVIQTLHFLKKSIMEKLNAQLGKNTVKDIKFKVGNFR